MWELMEGYQCVAEVRGWQRRRKWIKRKPKEPVRAGGLTGHLISWFIVVLVLSIAVRAEAHNGAVALAYPVEGIAVDGDFSDWKGDLPRYSITRTEYGVPPEDADDFQGSFRIGYDAAEHVLYVAVEISSFPVRIRGQALVLNIARDITDRKRAEEALRDAHRELEQRIIERTADITRANESLQDEITERKEIEEERERIIEELLGTYFLDHLLPRPTTEGAGFLQASYIR